MLQFFPNYNLVVIFEQLVKQEHVINATQDIPLQNQLFPLFKYNNLYIIVKLSYPYNSKAFSFIFGAKSWLLKVSVCSIYKLEFHV